MSSMPLPSISSEDVQSLRRTLFTDAQPVAVRHQPLSGKPLQECFSIVAQLVALCGGSQVFGWAIFEIPGIWLEAEFHTVWESPDGSLFDVTPRPFELDEILFLPDPARRYEGIQVATVFHPLTQNSAVLRHIQLARELFIERNRGELAFASSYEQTPRMSAIQAEMDRLEQQFPFP